MTWLCADILGGSWLLCTDHLSAFRDATTHGSPAWMLHTQFLIWDWEQHMQYPTYGIDWCRSESCCASIPSDPIQCCTTWAKMLGDRNVCSQLPTRADTLDCYLHIIRPCALLWLVTSYDLSGSQPSLHIRMQFYWPSTKLWRTISQFCIVSKLTDKSSLELFKGGVFSLSL